MLVVEILTRGSVPSTCQIVQSDILSWGCDVVGRRAMNAVPAPEEIGRRVRRPTDDLSVLTSCSQCGMYSCPAVFNVIRTVTSGCL